MKKFSKINISYESDDDHSNNSDFDYNNIFFNLGENNICPYYYFNKIITQGTPDLIISTYKDFFDPKSRIKLTNIIPVDQRSSYKLIFDE